MINSFNVVICKPVISDDMEKYVTFYKSGFYIVKTFVCACNYLCISLEDY